MAVYVIGDLQGCYDDLQRLLEHIHFDKTVDSLWFTGDLVNRGPQSLHCLRFVRDLGKHAITVLGNHDLSLLATAAGFRRPHRKDTLDGILNAPDRDELLDWLRHQPLLYDNPHNHPENAYVLIHAGLPPQWTIDDARQYAREVETVLRSGGYLQLLQQMYGDLPDRWSDSLTGYDRWRFIINCLTRLRYCTLDGRLDMKAKLAPEVYGGQLLPWFRMPERRSRDTRIIFGHWSTLGLLQENNIISIDTGCIWGGKLTAVRIDTETPEFCSVACEAKQTVSD
jgi:bis(5'-nucleosyl)-tetraphosphatase (symmetrical)